MITKEQICQVIPHRAPFLLVDAITQHTQGRSTTGEYHVNGSLHILLGHFPGKPILPGVLVIEHMAQVACYAIGSSLKQKDQDYYLVRINQSTFHQPVYPEDDLTTTVELIRQFDEFASFKCCTLKSETVVAEAELLVAFKNKSGDEYEQK